MIPKMLNMILIVLSISFLSACSGVKAREKTISFNSPSISDGECKKQLYYVHGYALGIGGIRLAGQNSDWKFYSDFYKDYLYKDIEHIKFSYFEQTKYYYYPTKDYECGVIDDIDKEPKFCSGKQKAIAKIHTKYSAKDHAKELKNFILKKNENSESCTDIVILGHSYGGQIVREFIRLYNNNYHFQGKDSNICLKGAAFIQSPHQGASTISGLFDQFLCDKAPCAALRHLEKNTIELKDLNKSMNELEEVWTSIPLIFVGGTLDVIVPKKSALASTSDHFFKHNKKAIRLKILSGHHLWTHLRSDMMKIIDYVAKDWRAPNYSKDTDEKFK